MPGTARWGAMLALAVNALQTTRDEMEDYAGERSEEWQEGEKGEEHQARIDAIDDALGTLEEITW